MVGQNKQPQNAEGGRYKSFEEFTDHFYGPKQDKKREDEPNASFGLELSRDLVRQNVGKTPKEPNQ